MGRYISSSGMFVRVSDRTLLLAFSGQSFTTTLGFSKNLTLNASIVPQPPLIIKFDLRNAFLTRIRLASFVSPPIHETILYCYVDRPAEEQ